MAQPTFNQVITAEDLEQTIVKSGLLCFGPFNTKIGRVLFKHRILEAIAKKKKFFKPSKNDETCAQVEFEIRRFPSTQEMEGAKWHQEVKETWDEYEAMNALLKQQKSDTLDNLKLQSQVYREEITSLKRQIDALKREREDLHSDLIPKIKDRRRSLYY